MSSSLVIPSSNVPVAGGDEEKAVPMVEPAQGSNGNPSSISMSVNGSFKIQKISDPVFDQDSNPELWGSWKHKVEVYCRSYGKCYVDVLKSKESSVTSLKPAAAAVTAQSFQGAKCNCIKKEDQQLVLSRRHNKMICVSCGDTSLRPTLAKANEIEEQINAQIHGLLMTNMSNETFTKYCYSVESGDGAALWKHLCDANEMFTNKLQLSIRKEILTETIQGSSDDPWLALSQFLDRLVSKYARLRLISNDPISEHEMLAVLENAIRFSEQYKDLRSWMKLSRPPSFNEAVLQFRQDIVDEKIKSDRLAVPTLAATKDTKTPPGDSKSSSDSLKEENNYAGQQLRGGYRGRGRGRGGMWRGRGARHHHPREFRDQGEPQQRTFTCYNCGGHNHKAIDCPSPPSNDKDKGEFHRDHGYKNSSRERSIERSRWSEMLFAEEAMNADTGEDHKQAKGDKTDEIYFDSGASTHIFGNSRLLSNISKLRDPVCAIVANGNSVSIDTAGEVHLKGVYDNSVTITNVRSCSAFTKNLLSVAQLVDRGLEVVFTKDGAVAKRGTTILLTARRVNNMFVLNNEIMEPSADADSKESAWQASEHPVDHETMKLWHYRLGHCDLAKLRHMKSNGVVLGMSEAAEDRSLRGTCYGCAMGKSRRDDFHDHSSRAPATRPLMRIFHDNSGAVRISGLDKSHIKKLHDILATEKYLSLIVDEYSGYLMGKPIYTKDQAVQHIMDTIVMEENQTGCHVQIANADNSGEFNTTKLVEFLNNRGIRRNLTTKETPQHNAIAESALGTVFNACRANLQHANLHPVFWAYAMLATIVALNCVSTYRDPSMSRTERFYQYRPSVKKLRVFGCDAYVHILKKDRASKVNQTAVKCIFLGYDELRENSYIFFDPEQMAVFTSRDVVFRENEFTCGRQWCNGSDSVLELEPQAETNMGSHDERRSIDTATVKNSIFAFKPWISGNVQQMSAPATNPGGELQLVGGSRQQHAVNPAPIPVSGLAAPDHKEEAKAVSVPAPAAARPNAIQRHGGRNRQAPERPNMIPSSLLHLYAQEKNEEFETPLEQCYLVEEGPATFAEAMHRPDADKWLQACEVELATHVKNNSWTLVDRTKSMHVIPSRWVLVVKIDPHNGERKYKARLVVKGFKQWNGVDYFDDQVSSSVLAAKSLRIILTITAFRSHELHQMDAVSAFTQADLEQDIFAQQPEGFEVGSTQVCKLNKALYGLKQASYLWQQALRRFMEQEHWTSCILDENVFFRRSASNRLMIIGIYVDDILISYHPRDKEEFQAFLEALKKRFVLKDVGMPKSILGMNLTYDKQRKVIHLDHHQYVEQILERHRMENAKSHSTPASEEQLGPEHCPTTDSQRLEMQQYPYRALVGELLYLAHMSRPDISHIVGVLSRFLENPGKKHWEAAKRVLRYLKGSIHLGLEFRGDASSPDPGQLDIEAYSDADWGRDLHGRKSVFGFIIQLNGNPIAWVSRKQSFVAQSTCESEYVGMSEAVREIRWIHQLLHELNLDVSIPTLNGDNQSAILLASNTRMDNRIKSIDIKYHYIKDEVARKNVQLQYVATDANLADVFTKPLGNLKFSRIRNRILGNVD